jgi:hypothetical protein
LRIITDPLCLGRYTFSHKMTPLPTFRLDRESRELMPTRRRVKAKGKKFERGRKMHAEIPRPSRGAGRPPERASGEQNAEIGHEPRYASLPFA